MSNPVKIPSPFDHVPSVAQSARNLSALRADTPLRHDAKALADAYEFGCVRSEDGEYGLWPNRVDGARLAGLQAFSAAMRAIYAAGDVRAQAWSDAKAYGFAAMAQRSRAWGALYATIVALASRGGGQ